MYYSVVHFRTFGTAIIQRLESGTNGQNLMYFSVVQFRTSVTSHSMLFQNALTKKLFFFLYIPGRRGFLFACDNQFSLTALS